MLNRYKLVIQYDGKQYFGWQLQKDVRTVQYVIEKAILKIQKSKNRIKIFGSGRTDAGVHAWGQVAHFDLDTRLDETNLKNALNSNLPEDCRIIIIKKVNTDFHSRHNASRRYYRYQCYTGESILFRNQCWLTPKLNIEFLNDLAECLIGNKDFLSFCKFRKDLNTTKCIIYNSNWFYEQEILVFRISANRYLHHMIRYLVGTMIAVYENKVTKSYFISLLNEPRKNVKIYKAPPQGLILEKVDYA